MLKTGELSKEFGAGGRTRTDDLLITNQLLYQLSYAGKAWTGEGSILARELLPAVAHILQARGKLGRFPRSLREISCPGACGPLELPDSSRHSTAFGGT